MPMRNLRRSLTALVALAAPIGFAPCASADLRPDPASAGAHCGAAIALSRWGDTLIPAASPLQPSRRVVVHENDALLADDSAWPKIAELVPPDTVPASFGSAVAFVDVPAGPRPEMLVVAPDLGDAGQVHVRRENTPGTWTRVKTPAPALGFGDLRFGSATATAGTLPLVGKQIAGFEPTGTAFAPRRSQGVWTIEAELPGGDAAVSGACYGVSVAIENNIAAGGSFDGVVQLHRRAGPGTWAPHDRVDPATVESMPVQDTTSRFGQSLWFRRGLLAIGAPFAFAHQATLELPGTDAFDLAGYNGNGLSMQGSLLVAGVPDHEAVSPRGSGFARVLRRAANRNWALRAGVICGVGPSSSQVGAGVAIGRPLARDATMFRPVGSRVQFLRSVARPTDPGGFFGSSIALGAGINPARVIGAEHENIGDLVAAGAAFFIDGLFGP